MTNCIHGVLKVKNYDSTIECLQCGQTWYSDGTHTYRMWTKTVSPKESGTK